MQNIFVELLPPWVETGLQPAFYDKESGSVLQQTARMYAKVNYLVAMFNKFSEDTSEYVNEFVDDTNTEIQRFEHDTTETVDDYIEKFTQLKDFVDGYFDNLDVQEEINNKLDAMVEAGTLQEIITTYIQSNVEWTFETVADMKNSTNLIAGSFATTLGYHTLNDGGSAVYYITDTGTANEQDVIAVGDLYANLVLPFKVAPEAFGAYGDGTHDDSSAIQALIDYAIDSRSNIEFNKKTYQIGTTLLINKSSTSVNLIIDGNGATLLASTALDDDYIIRLKTPISATYGQENIYIKNLKLNGNWINKGIDIEKTNFWSFENVNIQRCLYGLRLCNTYYGNIDDNCIIGNCWYGIVMEDSADTTSNEVNTIRIGNISIQMPQSAKTNFDTVLTDTIGVKIDTLVNSIKLEGTIIEHYDIGVEGFTLANSPAVVGRRCIFTIDKCYFEDLGKVFEFKRQSSSNFLQPTAEFTNCRIYPDGTPSGSKVGELDCGHWTITGNQNFTLKIGTSPTNLEITTDLDDTFLDIGNINDSVVINKIGLPRTTRDNEIRNDGYLGRNRLVDIQNNNLFYHRMYYANANHEMKNYKAFSINAQNICFQQESSAPVGLIIDGDDGNKYMLGTESGSTVKLIPMNNRSRYFQTANSKTALWLWNNRNRFENGVEFYCIDIEKTVVCNNHNWLDKGDNHIAIGTSPVLSAYASNPSGIYWRPSWDVSFNRGVYWHATKYILGYDWFMNNSPRPTEILVYGVIANRPASPAQASYYYATDEDKYYYYDGSTWSEFTPSV